VRAALLLAALLAAACGGGGQRRETALPPEKGEKPAEPAAKVQDLAGDVVGIEVVGLTGERARQARGALHSAIGVGFDPQLASRDLQALWALGGISDASVDARQAAGGISLRYTVVSSPTIRTVDVRGAHAIPATQWLDNIPVKKGELFSPSLMTQVAQRMLGELRAFGHYSARVEWNTTNAPGGAIDVVISVEEGPQVSIGRLEFRGNQKVKKETLLGLLEQNGKTVVGGRYWRDALDNGLLHVAQHYYDNGYVNVRIGMPEEALSKDGGAIALAISIDEGPQFRVGKIDAKGSLIAPVKEYVKLLGVKKGQIFNRGAVAKGLERIQAMHQEKGAAHGEIVPDTVIDPKKKIIDLTVVVKVREAP
jgi:outer membrane protein insertion porin family